MRTRATSWRSILLAFSAVVALTAVAVTPAVAVTDGRLDGNGHPYVGLMVAHNASGVPQWRCSGTLLSSTVFLTAGHCTESPAAHVEVFFAPGPVTTDPDYAVAVAANGGANVPCGSSALFDGYPCVGDVGGTPHGHPQYDPDRFFLFDAGVVVLDDPMVMSQYGQLPTLNQLDALKPSRRVTFTSVGYGLQASFPAAASWKNEAARTRMVAEPHLVQINGGIVGDFAMILSNNASTGGTCFGDSGGPNFVGSSRVIAGVTSFGLNQTCAGTGGVYRIDRADDLNWIATFLD